MSHIMKVCFVLNVLFVVINLITANYALAAFNTFCALCAAAVEISAIIDSKPKY